MAIKTLFFDFDGVLADTEKLHYLLFQRVLKKINIDLSKEEYYERYLGYDDLECFQHVLREHQAEKEKLAIENIRTLIGEKAKLFQAEIAKKNYLFPDITDLIPRLEKNFPLCVISGALRNEVRGILDQNDLLGFIKVIVTAEDCENNKPHPDPYLLALKKLNKLEKLAIHPSEALVIEDSKFGIQSGLAAGMKTLGVLTHYDEQELKGAHAFISETRLLNEEIIGSF